VIHELGAANVVATAQQMGLRCCTNVGEPRTPLHPYDSAVLGTNEVNSLEMASAYGTLATGGQHVQPVPAVSITDAQGNVIWQAHPDPKQVIDPKIAAVTDGILRNVVLYGTGKSANIGRPQIGKTGTAENFANAWFIGAVPQLVASVWVGFHQGNIDMIPPRTRITVYGGTWPADIWRLFMLRATAGMAASPFPVPQVGYVSEAVDVTQDPYCLPNRYTLPINIQTMQFFQGTQPTKVCTTPTASQPLLLPSVIGLHANEAISVLKRAGFNVQVGETASTTQLPGTVVYETPSAGTTALSSSTVRITVARAPPVSGPASGVPSG
jgi:penicillin-binding protein 1A